MSRFPDPPYDLTIVDPDTGNTLDGPFDDGTELQLVYECPFCDHEQEDHITTPVPEYAHASCQQCNRTYRLYATILPHTMEDTLYNRIAFQLRGQERLEPIRERNPDDVQYLSIAPENVIVGGVITLFALIGIIGVSVSFPTAIQTNLVFLTAFVMLVVAVSLGVATAIATSGGAAYRTVLLIKANEWDESLNDFILYAANVRDTRTPFLIRDDIF